MSECSSECRTFLRPTQLRTSLFVAQILVEGGDAKERRHAEKILPGSIGLGHQLQNPC